MKTRVLRKAAVVLMVMVMLAGATVLALGAADPGKFTDVTSHWAKAEITELVNRGMFVGVSDTAFDPDGGMSRGMVATVLHRHDGYTAMGANVFSDLPAGEWYTEGSVWAANNGIIAVATATTFNPNAPITREELASALYNYARYLEAAPKQTLTSTTLRLSTTTSVNDSGLLGYLRPYFEADTGITLQIASAGTGAAITAAKNGNADALLVHEEGSELGFINDGGYGELRVPFMYNYFIIVGPADDPAGVKNAKSASEAFKKIAETNGALFISRGDNSGTHVQEQNIWKAAGISPDPAVQSWYVSIGGGMGAALNMAVERGAYVLTDKGTYLSHNAFKQNLLPVLYENADMEMYNPYSIIDVSTKRFGDTNATAAQTFLSWMTSAKAAGLINAYRATEGGDQLFFSMLTNLYSDSGKLSEGSWEAMNWAVGNGIVEGYPDSTLKAGGGATRAEVVTMLCRFLKLMENK